MAKKPDPPKLIIWNVYKFANKAVRPTALPDGTYRPARAASGSKSAIRPASPCSGSAVRFGIDEPQAARANGEAMTRRNGEIERQLM
jgi:hypothetical protein